MPLRPLLVLRSQESPTAPISAPQLLAPLQSQSASDDRKDADRSPEDAGFKGDNELYHSGDPEHEDDRSLGEVPLAEERKTSYISSIA